MGFKTTDNNNAVEQINGDGNNINYRVLLSSSESNTTTTSNTVKDPDFYYNPSTKTLTVNSIKIGDAILKYDSAKTALVVEFEE